jgi:hypothetical protein
MSYKLIEKQVIYTGTKIRLELHHLEDDDGKRTQREFAFIRGPSLCCRFWMRRRFC